MFWIFSDISFLFSFQLFFLPVVFVIFHLQAFYLQVVEKLHCSPGYSPLLKVLAPQQRLQVGKATMFLIRDAAHIVQPAGGKLTPAIC